MLVSWKVVLLCGSLSFNLAQAVSVPTASFSKGPLGRSNQPQSVDGKYLARNLLLDKRDGNTDQGVETFLAKLSSYREGIVSNSQALQSYDEQVKSGSYKSSTAADEEVAKQATDLVSDLNLFSTALQDLGGKQGELDPATINDVAAGVLQALVPLAGASPLLSQISLALDLLHEKVVEVVAVPTIVIPIILTIGPLIIPILSNNGPIIIPIFSNNGHHRRDLRRPPFNKAPISEGAVRKAIQGGVLNDFLLI